MNKAIVVSPRRLLISAVNLSSRLLLLRSSSTMPPKQATLGYVKPSQTTLGCVESYELSNPSVLDIVSDATFIQEVLWGFQ